MLTNTYANTLLFGIYPYVCLAIFFFGCLVRFDREPYTWKSDSSQMLRKRELWLGSNLFHYGVIIVLLGHFAGFFTPTWVVSLVLTPTQHQVLAMVVGGIAGAIAIIGMSILIYRRLTDPRIRLNSRKRDIVIVFMLWAQLALGLLTLPFAASDKSGRLLETLISYVKGIVVLDGNVAALMLHVPLVYKLHVLLGFSILLVTPITRMVHIWSGVSTPVYLWRPYQIVRALKPATKKEKRP